MTTNHDFATPPTLLTVHGCVPCSSPAQVAMPQRKFAQHVAQLVTAKLTPDAALSDQSDRWWAEIESRRCVVPIPAARLRLGSATRACRLTRAVPRWPTATHHTGTTSVHESARRLPCAA